MDRLTARWPSWRWAPPVLIAVATGVDLTTPAIYTAAPLTAAACVLAGAMLTLRGAVGTGVLALVLTVLLEWDSGRLAAAASWSEIVNVALAAALGIDMNQMLERRDRRIATVRSVAAAMQRAVLPTPPREIGPVRVAARYEAADAEARVGGDAYAIQDTPYGVRVLIGDVRGKGVEAVSTTATLIGAFREAAHYVPDIGELAVRLEDALERDSVRHDDDRRTEEFTTALLAEIDHGCGSLRVVNRGHPEPYLIRDGRVTALTPTTPDLPLSMGHLTDVRARPDVVPLSPGDVVLFVTDGVTEARTPEGAFYDPGNDPGLAAGEPATPDTVLDALEEAVHRWTGGSRDDDMATLALTPRYLPAGAPGAGRQDVSPRTEQ
ncbi:serine/threonine-protein phosphatase [Streptomyces sp. NBC_01754]|uniref:PP2C family protein-serine/threonine phosphatase n=1 Tax=Streptomyces sp. NBC_01754 TaxID=2975930 RepID=UPI002DD7C9D7|nr:PP2C family protein-serine/threonine phosphatase [Streptomyces sp. NBC_01754]WSC91143.1 serine/threonine-protein phosphatase [Streptomyces sp. NBC_01754]